MKTCPQCRSTFPKDFVLCPRDGTPLVDQIAWAGGCVIREKYRILGRIGAGGMATVYQAEHIVFRELRALKVINPELASDPDFVRRFFREAVLTRRLHHPNAVRVDDVDRGDDGNPFIVMEYIEGPRLRDV